MAIKFWEFYKKRNALLQIVLFSVLILIGVLWVIGSLARFDRAIMFILGVISSFVLTYLFYPEIQLFITRVLSYIEAIQNF